MFDATFQQLNHLADWYEHSTIGGHSMAVIFLLPATSDNNMMNMQEHQSSIYSLHNFLLLGAESFFSWHFMEPKCSLLHLQEPATPPYPEPDQCNPCPPIPLLEVPSSYYPPIYACVFQVVSFPQIFKPKLCIHLSFPPYVLHAPPISFFWI
jgi:hypothetical protein